MCAKSLLLLGVNTINNTKRRSLAYVLFYDVYKEYNLYLKISNIFELALVFAFSGFVGLYNCLFLWPLFFLIHYNVWEVFSLPDRAQWVTLLVEGLLGTVLSETLWLYGMLLTSPLIATLALGLTMPMSMIVNMSLYQVTYSR